MKMNYILLLIFLPVMISTTEAFVAKRNCGIYSHGEQWINTTLPCVSYRCKDGVTHPRYTGCVWRNECYEVNQTWTKDCADMKCVSYNSKNVTYFRIKARLGCTWKNKCQAGGAVWEDDCDVYRCAVTISEQSQTAKVETIQPRCSLNGKCYNDSSTWFERCTWYKCEIRTSLGQTSKKIIGVPGCIYNNKCYVVGKQRKNPRTCITTECVQGNGRVTWKPIAFGCLFNNSCIQENSTWTDRKTCMKLTCKKAGGINKAVLTGSPSGCFHDKVCRSVGESWMMNCLQLKCATDGTGEHTISVRKSLCRDKFGACHDWGTKGIQMRINGTDYPDCMCVKKSSRFSNVRCKTLPNL